MERSGVALKRLLEALCNQGAAGSNPAAGTILSIHISNLSEDIASSRCRAYSPRNQDLGLTALSGRNFADSSSAILALSGHFGADHLIMH